MRGIFSGLTLEYTTPMRQLGLATLLLTVLLSACGSNGANGGSALDTTDPTITLVSVNTNVTQAGEVIISAHAQDNVAVKEVSFFLDNQPLGSPVVAPPYQVKLDWSTVGNGLHRLRAVVSDTSGRTSETTVDVTVTIPGNTPPNSPGSSDTTPVSVTLSGPPQVTLAGTARYRATITGNASKVEFYDNGYLKSTLAQESFVYEREYTYADNGTRIIRVVVYDKTGKQVESSVMTRINIPAPMPGPLPSPVPPTPPAPPTPPTPPAPPAPADTTPPSVSIVIPASNIVVAGNYTVTVNASDNVAVTRLEATLVSPRGTQTFALDPKGGSLTINVTSDYNGDFTLKVTAYDAAGNSASATASAYVNIH